MEPKFPTVRLRHPVDKQNQGIRHCLNPAAPGYNAFGCVCIAADAFFEVKKFVQAQMLCCF